MWGLEKMKKESKFDFLVAAFMHDLKNQLQSVSAQQDILVNELPKKYQRQLTPMLKQINKIKDDTLKLVSLFRLENNDNFAMDNAWPKDTASNAIESCHLQFPKLHINNSINQDAQGFYNEQLIELALVTLITNSAQAGAKHVELLCEEGDHQSLNIIVHDNGPGFNQDIIDGLADTTKAEGTGLGLSFVKMICQAHEGSSKQGFLSIYNADDGATATLFLP
ncbi:MAG: signal transduction histidine kinase [Oleispira sp.]|jgi:signal transduction histidine kinase